MSDMTFERRRDFALAVLTKGERLTRKSGSFLGQLVVDPTPMTAAQTAWFSALLERAGLAAEGGNNG